MNRWIATLVLAGLAAAASSEPRPRAGAAAARAPGAARAAWTPGRVVDGPFADVPAGNPAMRDLDTLAGAGLVPAGAPGARRTITRYEVAVAVERAARAARDAGSSTGLPARVREALGRLQRNFAAELRLLGGSVPDRPYRCGCEPPPGPAPDALAAAGWRIPPVRAPLPVR